MALSVRARWIVLLLALPILAAAWWLGSPLFIDRTVDEAFPNAAAAVVPQGMTRAEVEQEMASIATTNREVAEQMPGDRPPQVLRQGFFGDVDRIHKGTGKATIYRLATGEVVLRFEDFRVTNGPDLRVLLASHSAPKTREDLESANYVEIAGLKGNLGNQNYAIPMDIDTSDYSSVVIYCRPFHVVFSVATLAEFDG